MSQLLQGKTIAFLNNSLEPKDYWNGIAMDSTAPAAFELSVDNVSDITHYHQGLPLQKDDRIAIEEAVPAFFNSGAMPITASGRLAIATFPEVAVSFLAGNGYTATGQLLLE